MPATKEKFVGFWVTPDQERAIKEAAEKDGRSVSSFARHHLVRVVQPTQPPQHSTSSAEVAGSH